MCSSPRPVGARAHPAQVVVDLGQRYRDRAQRARGLDESVAVGLRLEVVLRLGDRQLGLGGEQLDDLLRESERRVDAGPGGGAAQRNLGDAGECRLHALDAEAHLTGVAAELLAERDRGGVHEVRAAGLHRVLPQLGLRLEGDGEVVERGDERVDERLRDGDVHGGREHVVRRLRGVHVVVRVHVRTEDAGGESGEHLVHVHVRRRAGARLVGVDRELTVVGTGGHLVGGLGDRVGDGPVEGSQLLVRECSGLLDARERGDLGGLQALARDREVLDGALRLCAIERVHGNPHLAHGVVLDAVPLRVCATVLVGHSEPSLVAGPCPSVSFPSVSIPTVMTGTAVPSARR